MLREEYKLDAIELAALNLREVRRRSYVVWRAIPDKYLSWKPDVGAMTFGEAIRHIWCAQAGYHEILKCGRSVDMDLEEEYDPIESVESEITLSEVYFCSFLDYVLSLSSDELSYRMIDRSDIGYVRTVGDMLARIAYHESVHTGQLLQYMRMAGLDRPDIWD